MSLFKRSHPSFVFTLLVVATVSPLVVAAVSLSPAAVAAPAVRVLAVGDVHGARQPLVEILQTAHLLDAEERWVGGNTILVQAGDFLDRGAEAIEVMDLLMRLQEEAPRHGGQVVVLLGNHEAMNLLGVMRDVSPKIYERLAGPDSAARQEELYKNAVRLFRARNKKVSLPDNFEMEWKRRHPPGYFEYCQLFQPEAKYGRWLRTLPGAFKLDDMFFIHAGLSTEMTVPNADFVTALVQDDLAFHDAYRALLLQHGLISPVTTYKELSELAPSLMNGGYALASVNGAKGEIRKRSREFDIRQQDWSLTDINGPLWFRGFAKWRQGEGMRNIRTLARTLQVEHFIVGHSPVRDRSIHHRFGGAVFLTDTGMLAEHYHGGRPSVLERVGERWTAIYPDTREVILGPGPREALADRWLGPNGGYLPFQSDGDALKFLREAEIVSTQTLGSGINRTLQVLLRQGDVEAHAAFRSVDLKLDRAKLGKEVVTDFHDSYRYEVAAYQFSRLLGLDAIPPVVLRDVEGEKGSLQLWVEGVTTESEKNENKFEPPDWTAWYRQLQTMRIFDRLIFNFDRNRGNILVSESWRLWMIDHTRSFRTSVEVPALSSVTHCEKDLWRRIRELTEEEVRRSLEPHVGLKQIKALMKRRDRVVERMEEVIAKHGEEYVIYDIDKNPNPQEVVHLADDQIESFLDGLGDESSIPDELLSRGSSRR